MHTLITLRTKHNKFLTFPIFVLVFRCSDCLLFLGTLGVRFGNQETQSGHSVPGGALAVPRDGGIWGVVRTRQSDSQHSTGPHVPAAWTELEVRLCHTQVVALHWD